MASDRLPLNRYNRGGMLTVCMWSGHALNHEFTGMILSMAREGTRRVGVWRVISDIPKQRNYSVKLIFVILATIARLKITFFLWKAGYRTLFVCLKM